MINDDVYKIGDDIQQTHWKQREQIKKAVDNIIHRDV